jgi:hypothetical protein
MLEIRSCSGIRMQPGTWKRMKETAVKMGLPVYRAVGIAVEEWTERNTHEGEVQEAGQGPAEAEVRP